MSTEPTSTDELTPSGKSMQKALALLAFSMAAQMDARALLATLLENYRQAIANQAGSQADTFDELATAMLLSVSSAALKQHPQDPAVLQMYRDLRPGERH